MNAVLYTLIRKALVERRNPMHLGIPSMNDLISVAESEGPADVDNIRPILERLADEGFLMRTEQRVCDACGRGVSSANAEMCTNCFRAFDGEAKVETRHWFLFGQGRIIDSAIRVPTLIPGYWIYLRSWLTIKDQYAERTHDCDVGVIVAPSADVAAAGVLPAWVKVLGLKEQLFQNLGTITANQAQIDTYLLSLGAEPVPADEWPDGCVGNAKVENPDRVPFGRDESWVQALRLDDAVKLTDAMQTADALGAVDSDLQHAMRGEQVETEAIGDRFARIAGAAVVGRIETDPHGWAGAVALVAEAHALRTGNDLAEYRDTRLNEEQIALKLAKAEVKLRRINALLTERALYAGTFQEDDAACLDAIRKVVEEAP